jgi:autotransporter adhesin
MLSSENNVEFTNINSQITSLQNTVSQLGGNSTATASAGPNTDYGQFAGMQVTGTGNVAVGKSTGSEVTGMLNVAIGDNAGQSITGSTNTGLGADSSSTISGAYNAGSGYGSSRAILGDANTGMGALSSINVTGSENSGVGYASSIKVVGFGNTTVGASSGQLVTGTANSALGLGAGQNVTGNANIAIGQNAGSAGIVTVTATLNTAASVPKATTSTVKSMETRYKLDDGQQTVTTTTAPVQGNNNVAIGTNAGLGTGTSFSDTVALGTNAAATQSSAVAIGANAVASGANSVALGANSIANEANTVSVGGPGAERRITNVAQGVQDTDAATFGQLRSVANQAQQGINVADKGVAMALAGANATNVSTKAGETAMSMGSGYFEGNAAVGVGVASASGDGERVFRFGSAISPGLADVTLQASYQMRVGNKAPDHSGGNLVALKTLVPYSLWEQHGFSDVFEDAEGSLYRAKWQDRAFRLQLISSARDSGKVWAVTVDEKLRDGSWRSIEDSLNLHADAAPGKILAAAIDALAKFARTP